MTTSPAADPARASRRHPEQRQLEAAFAGLELPTEERANLCRRYLDYMDWLESAATRSRRAYYGLRLVAAVLAAVVPALVAADLGGTGRAITIGLGIVVAAATTTEAFLHLGDRWRHYRLAVELLKAQAWLFAQRAGPYASATPAESLREFVERMEALIHDEVRDYVSTVVAEREASNAAARDGDNPTTAVSRTG